jgi:hypothetical protein
MLDLIQRARSCRRGIGWRRPQLVDDPFDVTHEELPLRVEVGAGLDARSRARTELPDASLHRVLMERGIAALRRAPPSRV